MATDTACCVTDNFSHVFIMLLFKSDSLPQVVVLMLASPTLNRKVISDLAKLGSCQSLFTTLLVISCID